MTVWALPRSDLQTRPTETPAADAAIAARRPAPPAPMTSTSCSTVRYSGMDRREAHRILQSVQIPIEHSRTEMSAKATEKRLAQAHRMWVRLRQLEQA